MGMLFIHRGPLEFSYYLYKMKCAFCSNYMISVGLYRKSVGLLYDKFFVFDVCIHLCIPATRLMDVFRQKSFSILKTEEHEFCTQQEQQSVKMHGKLVFKHSQKYSQIYT